MKLAENLEPPVFWQSFPCSMPVHKITIIIIILVSNGTERYRVLFTGVNFSVVSLRFQVVGNMQLFASNGPCARKMVTGYKNTLLNGRRHRMKIQGTLSLTGGGWGFPPASKNEAPGYFRRKTEEK